MTMFPTSPNSQRQPQGDEHPEGQSITSIFRRVNDLDIRNGDFPLVSAKEEVGNSTGMFNYLCQMSQNHNPRLSHLPQR